MGEPILSTPIASTTPPQSAALATMLSYGRKKVDANGRQLFMAAISAGVYIALAFVFYITVTTGAGNTGWGVTRLIGGIVFSMGLILIVIGGGELFTSSTLLVANRLEQSSSTRTTLRCWGIIYLGNLLGAGFCAVMVYLAGLYQLDHGLWGDNLMHIALHKLHHTPVQAIALGTLCNMLVCLGIWMTFATKDLLTKAVLLIMPVAMFVSSGFEHSIANLFLLPAAWLVKTLAITDLPTQTQALPLADITLGHILTNNLLPVTLGNILGGGVLVGGYHWLTYKKPTANADTGQLPVKAASITAQSSDRLPLSQLSQPVALSLRADTSVLEASHAIRKASSQSCFVLDEQEQLLGTLSQADLFGAWLHDPQATTQMSIRPLVKPVLLAVDITDSLTELKQQLSQAMAQQPRVSETGILTDYSQATQPEYTRYQPAPELIPVMEQHKLVGCISCDALLDEYLGESGALAESAG